MAAVVPTSSVSTQALICEEGLHLQLSPNCPSAQESLKHRVTSGVRPLIVGVTWARGEPEEPVVALEGDQLPQPTLLTRKEERAHSRRLGMPKLPMDQVKTAACTLRKTTKGGVLPLDP